MKICHITTVHQRYDVRIFHKQCKSLAANFSEVFLIVADGLGDETIDNINIQDIGTKKNSRINRFTKTVNKAVSKAISINADIYHLHDPELLRVVKKLKGNKAKIIFDSHEDLPGQIITKPYIPKIIRKPLAFFIEKYENKKVRKIDGVITATPFIRDKFLKVNKNCIDINNYPLLSEMDSSNENFEKENTVCYIGGITEIRGISQLIKALEYTEVKLDLAGEIPADYKKDLIKLKAWRNVNELGYITREKSVQIKKKSIAGMVTFLPAPNHINSQPNKIFEYMSSEIPVIGSDFPLWKQIIEDNNCGLCVNPLNPYEISEAINYLVQNPAEAKKMGSNGKKLVLEKYNWQIEEKKLFDFYNKILEQ